VLDGVLYDRPYTTCQIEGLLVRIDPISFWGPAGESLEANTIHFVLEHAYDLKLFMTIKTSGFPAVSKGSRPCSPTGKLSPVFFLCWTFQMAGWIVRTLLSCCDSRRSLTLGGVTWGY
jgi:hypothetical protein